MLLKGQMMSLCLVNVVLVWLVCCLSNVGGTAPSRFRMFYDMNLNTYDSDGELKQLKYCEKAIDKSNPLICFVIPDSQIYCMLSCSKLKSRLDAPLSYQRIFNIFGSTYIAFSGNKPDWEISKRELYRFVVSKSRLHASEISSTEIAKYISSFMSERIVSSMMRSSVKDTEENEGKSFKKINSRLPIGKLLSRPLASCVLIPNSNDRSNNDSLVFWNVNAAGSVHQSKSFLVGKINPFVVQKVEDVIRTSASKNREARKNFVKDFIVNIVDSMEGLELFELVVINRQARKSGHVLPTTKIELESTLEDIVNDCI